MMKNYLELDLPFKFIKDDIVTPDYDDQWHYRFVESHEYLTTEAIEFFKSIGVNELICQFFRGSIGSTTSIHVDARVLDDGSLRIPREWAINIVWGCDDSEMFWFKTKDENPQKTLGVTGIIHPVYEPDQVELIEQYRLTGKPLLCHIAIPHSVTNYDKKNYRWCMSIRPVVTDLNWENAYKFFERYSA